MNNSVKWRLIIVPIKIEQINNYLYIDIDKSDKIKIGMHEMRVNDSEMSMRFNNEIGQYWRYQS